MRERWARCTDREERRVLFCVVGRKGYLHGVFLVSELILLTLHRDI